VPDGFSIGEVYVGAGELFLIAGPCVIESEVHSLKMAESIATITSRKKLPYIFKSSYDKANRTAIGSFRGPGIAEGLRILARIRKEFGLPVLTDVHEVADVARVAEVVDVLQIPALLCRQTDLLVAAAASGRAVNIKKGQFVSPWDMRHAVDKVRGAGADRVLLTERGASFGYNNLVVDMRSLAIMRAYAPVVLHPNPPVPAPSARGGNRPGTQQSGGQPEFIPLLSRAAVAAGVDGVFMEVHDDPSQAKSDGANSLDLKNLADLLEQLIAVHQALDRTSACRSGA